MIEEYITIAVALVIGGATGGALAVLAVGIRREEKARSLAMSSPSRITDGTRAVNGVYARKPGVIQQTSRQPRDAPPLSLRGREEGTR